MVFGSSLVPHASLLKPCSSSTGPVVHPCGLTGLAKKTWPSMRADLVWLCNWCPMGTYIVDECTYVATMLSYKLDFSSCDNSVSFYKSSHNFAAI